MRDMMVWPARMLCGPRASVPPLTISTFTAPAFCFSTTSLVVNSSSSTISLTGFPSCADAVVARSAMQLNTPTDFFIDPPRMLFARHWMMHSTRPGGTARHADRCASTFVSVCL
jgi:hypothetical protein